MEIISMAVRADLDAGRPLKLNLGSGRRSVPGFYNVDCVDLPEVDVLADLNEPFGEIPDNAVDAVYCRHTLEHVDRFMDLLAEIHRVVRPGGEIEIIVPHFSNPYYYSDPTHVRFFGLYSFFYFCDEADQPRRKVPNFYSQARFQVQSVRFNLMKEGFLDRVVRGVFQPLINRGIGWLDWYERRMCRLFPVSDVRYLLSPVKTPAKPTADEWRSTAERAARGRSRSESLPAERR